VRFGGNLFKGIGMGIMNKKWDTKAETAVDDGAVAIREERRDRKESILLD
jgi:hypothetical protein